MHIPDGYLSPSTCAALYAGSAPFWVIALRRVQAKFQARYLPLVSLFSAFSFVVMMFNLPLPGGTTGHAVGMGVAAVARAVGFDPGDLGGAGDPGGVLRGRGHHGLRSELFQHGHRRLADRLGSVPRRCGPGGVDRAAACRGGGARGLPGDQRVGAVRSGGVWHPAGIVS